MVKVLCLEPRARPGGCDPPRGGRGLHREARILRRAVPVRALLPQRPRARAQVPQPPRPGQTSLSQPCPFSHLLHDIRGGCSEV